MLDQLLPYYEKELAHLRRLSGEFAHRYPKIARRLLLEDEQCEDPHVERLIEGFAFLAARIHKKLDDEYPEISEAFLQTLYPHYTRPFASTTILRFELDEAKPEITDRHSIARGQTVLTPPVNGEACKFRTAYDVDLWPIKLATAKLELTQSSPYLRRLNEAYGVLTLEFETLGKAPFAQLNLDQLRLFIDAEPPLAYFLYEILFSKTRRIDVCDGSDDPRCMARLPAERLRPVGFARDEALLDYDSRSFEGYRLLTEYFAYPEKFLFFDLTGLDAPAARPAGNKLRVRIWLDRFAESDRISRMIETINAQRFRLFCAPAINLFTQAADPIRVTHTTSHYPVVPDARRPLAFEVISVDSVLRVDKSNGAEQTREVAPFYALDHHSATDANPLYWYSSRSRSTREFDRGTNLALTLCDLDFHVARPDSETLSLITTCSNRDGPEQLPFGGNAPDYQLPGDSIVKRVRPLRKPSSSLRAPDKPGLQWRLISHLSLNVLSLVAEGKGALQEMLALYNFTDSQAMARQIRGIAALESRAATARLSGAHAGAFVRGTEIKLTLDEDDFVGAGAYLFASVLERFFALYTAPNSFTRLKVHTKQREGEVFAWAPRSGQAPLI